MADRKTADCTRVSRRDFLFVATAGGGIVLGSGLVASPALAQTKRPQKAVSYRPTPNGHERCDNCANFQAPAACKQVEGPISPAGWCILYAAK